VARSFSGDKQQLVPHPQGRARHKGFALVDVISPCVTFNDHEGSTKSYAFTREHVCRKTISALDSGLTIRRIASHRRPSTHRCRGHAVNTSL
jgi:pyruvate/2-oxoacid:ferredoxin oxidoreductase beta subunit